MEKEDKNKGNEKEEIPKLMLTEEKIARMFKQQYRIVGNHSAIKICYWTKKDLKNEGKCYKHYFYGIDTHRCLEMSPAITCNQRCKHCWRDTSVFSKEWEGPIDDPKEIIKGSIEARREIMIGFKGNDKVDKAYFEEALKPSHVAISLTGEPCMYPRLVELVKGYYDFGARTIFLVTSGTVPERLQEFIDNNIFPTNIYLSVEARNKDEYKFICNPVIENAWEKVKESEKILSKIPTRTVMRITSIKGLNTDNMSGYLESIERMNPDYIEIKGYMFLGYSMLRLKRENMPNFEEIKELAKELEKISNYKIVDEHKPSNIVLLKRKTKRKEYYDELYE